MCQWHTEGASAPGPYPSDWHTLVVLLGDGTLLQQTRGRCQQAGACADLYGTDWELQTPLEHCDAVIEAKAIAGCDVPDGACAWSGQSSNCVVVPEPWDCSALEQAR